MTNTSDCYCAKRSGTSYTKSARPKILVVDDDADIQSGIEIRLKEFDVEILHAYHGMQGVNLAIEKQPSLIIADMAMPNGSGEYLMRCLENQDSTRSLPVIVMTGMRDPRIRNQAKRCGAAAYLQKPVVFERLLDEIQQHVQLDKST